MMDKIRLIEILMLLSMFQTVMLISLFLLPISVFLNIIFLDVAGAQETRSQIRPHPDDDCWLNTPLRNDLEKVWARMRKGESVTHQQLSDTYWNLREGSNGFGFLDAWGYPLCSQLWMQWNKQAGGSELDNWANNRQYVTLPTEDDIPDRISKTETSTAETEAAALPRLRHPYQYSKEHCSPGRILISFLCQHACMEQAQTLTDLPHHAVKDWPFHLNLGPMGWCQSWFNGLMVSEARRWRLMELGRRMWIKREDRGGSGDDNDDNIGNDAEDHRPFELWPGIFYEDIVATYQNSLEQVLLNTSFPVVEGAWNLTSRVALAEKLEMLDTEDEKTKTIAEDKSSYPTYENLDQVPISQRVEQLPTPLVFTKFCYEGHLTYGLDCASVEGGVWLGGMRFAITPDLCQRHTIRAGGNSAMWSETGECWSFICPDLPSVVYGTKKEQSEGFENREFRVMSVFCGGGRERGEHSRLEWKFVTEFVTDGRSNKEKEQVVEDSEIDLDVACVHDEDRQLEIATAKASSSEKSSNNIKVACALLAVYPAEKPMIDSHAKYTLNYCDESAVFIANSTFPTEEKTISGVEVNNLAKAVDGSVAGPNDLWENSMPDDLWNKGMPNTVEKYSRTLVAALDQFSDDIDWFCFLESDVYFVVENFKRFVKLKGLDKSSSINSENDDDDTPYFLGQVWYHVHQIDGLLLEPSQGTCANRSALKKLKNLFNDISKGNKVESVYEEKWPPTMLCDPFARYQHTEVMQKLNACFRTAKIQMLPHARDSVGRYFWGHGLHNIGTSVMESVQEKAVEGVRREMEGEMFSEDGERRNLGVEDVEKVMDDKIDALFEAGGPLLIAEKPKHFSAQKPYFDGSEHLWDRCGASKTLPSKEDRKQKRLPPLLSPPKPFVSKYPVVFHPHRSLEMGRFVIRNGVKVDKGGFSLRAVHHIVRTGKIACPVEICGETYRPQVYLEDGSSKGKQTQSLSGDSLNEFIETSKHCWENADHGKYGLGNVIEGLEGDENSVLNRVDLAAWVLENCGV